MPHLVCNSLRSSRHGWRRAVFLSFMPLALAVGPGAAQTDSSAARPDSSVNHRPLFSTRDAIVAAGFIGGTIAAFPLDKRIAHRLENPSTQANRFLRRAATGFEVIASPGAYIIGGSMYAVGRLGHFGRVADLGLHGTEAVLVGDAVTGLL